MGWGLLLSKGPLLTKQDLLNLSIFFNIVEFPEALAGSYRTMKQNAGNLSGNGKRWALPRNTSGANSDIPTSRQEALWHMNWSHTARWARSDFKDKFRNEEIQASDGWIKKGGGKKSGHTRWKYDLMCLHSIFSGLTSEVNAHLGRKLSTTLVWNLTAPIVYLLPPSKTQNGNKLSQRKLSPSSLQKTKTLGGRVCASKCWLSPSVYRTWRSNEPSRSVAFYTEIAPWQACPNRTQVRDLT